MFQPAGMVHEGGQRIGDRRMPGVAGLGGNTEIGQAQGLGGDSGRGHAHRPSRPCLPGLQEEADVKGAQGEQEQSQEQRRPHRLHTRLHLGAAPQLIHQSRGDFREGQHPFAVMVGLEGFRRRPAGEGNQL